MQLGNIFPLELPDETGSFAWMAKQPGPIPREGTTPAEYKAALAARIKARREELGLTIPEVAAQLSRAIGRDIRGDSYRQWETHKAVVQVDAILPLCDILRMHVYELLARPSAGTVQLPLSRGKQVA